MRALPGAQFLAQTEISFSLARKDAALATLSDGRRVRAQVTIAADGRDSALRAAAGVGVSRQRYDQSALVCAVAHDDADHEEVSTEIHMSGGPFTLVPMGGRRSAVVWMDSAARIAGLQAMSDSDFLAALNARSCGVLGSLRPLTGRAVWPMILQKAMAKVHGSYLALNSISPA